VYVRAPPTSRHPPGQMAGLIHGNANSP